MDALLIAALALIIVLLVAIIIRMELVARRTRALMDELREEVRYDVPPARRATIEGSILAVLRGAGAGEAEAGVAFFVSPTTALTVAHNLSVAGSVRRHLTRVTCVRPGDGARFTFDVGALDADLDFAVLRLRTGAASAHFLTVSRSIGIAAGDRGVFLVTCNIRLAAEAPDAASVGVAWHHARVVRFHPHNFLYDAPPFDGDSGGAIVVARTGEVIGLHKELVNAARELLEHKATVGERLNRVEASVQSLIRGSSFGCVGVRLDSDVARGLLDAAA
jgi:S1-C subfamily serine protease